MGVGGGSSNYVSVLRDLLTRLPYLYLYAFPTSNRTIFFELFEERNVRGMPLRIIMKICFDRCSR